MSQVLEAPSLPVIGASTADYRRAMVLACVLSGLFTIVGLVFPPSLSHDAGWGMQEWRTVAAGGPFNTIISPDPADISRDQAIRVTWWSPGQYLIPGVLTLLGIRLGTALAIIVGASLLCSLLGWIQVAKYFSLSPETATLIVALMATFHYSTLPFGIYNGGEVLLQGITPWIILTGCRAPVMSPLRAGGLACVAVWIAFFAKLTGVLVAAAALLIGSLDALARLRRVTAGMVGGAVGATLAFGSFYAAWFSRGTTPASGTGWSFRFANVFFGLIAPWGAGISWGDMLMALWRRSAADQPTEYQLPALFLWCLLPPVLLFLTVFVKGWQQPAHDENLRRLLTITAGFYGFSALAMIIIFSHGGDVSLDERHLRAAGMLILVCVLAVVSRLPRKSAIRWATFALCGSMSLFGCLAFAQRARSTKRQEIDRYSRTRQASVDRSAVEFARAAFAQEGRDDVFVLPAPDVACTLSPSARILSNNVQFESQSDISARTYHGKVPGRLYVIVPTRIAESVKGTLLLKEFVDYPVETWEKRSFGNSTVFIQGETGARN